MIEKVMTISAESASMASSPSASSSPFSSWCLDAVPEEAVSEIDGTCRWTTTQCPNLDQQNPKSSQS